MSTVAPAPSTAATILEALQKEHDANMEPLVKTLPEMEKLRLKIDEYNVNLNSSHGHDYPELQVLEEEREGFSKSLSVFQKTHSSMSHFQKKLSQQQKLISAAAFLLIPLLTLDWIDPAASAVIRKTYDEALTAHQTLCIRDESFSKLVQDLHLRITHIDLHPLRQVRERISLIKEGGDRSSFLMQFCGRAGRYFTWENTSAEETKAPDVKASTPTTGPAGNGQDGSHSDVAAPAPQFSSHPSSPVGTDDDEDLPATQPSQHPTTDHKGNEDATL